MSKLEYDNLYKFLVSLGIVLIVFPVAVLVYLFGIEPILISQLEYDELSAFSLQMLENRNRLTSFFISAFPWIAGILMFAGVVLLVCGIIKWVELQKKLDKKLDAETTIQTLNLMQMTKQEVTAKIEEEAKVENQEETDTCESPSGNSSANTQLNRIKKYIEIEDLCFNYFERKYTKKYSFKRNIRMGRYEYDFIGVSNNDSIDLIVEVKYWQVAAGISRRLYEFLDHFYEAGINYETIAHRNFRCIVALVTPKDQLPRLETIVETYCKAHRENASHIEIKCFAEEAL